jgi:hypothetical protein
LRVFITLPPRGDPASRLAAGIFIVLFLAVTFILHKGIEFFDVSDFIRRHISRRCAIFWLKFFVKGLDKK